jgi:hypothetical protein
MIFITQCDSPALWQTYLSDPASITMEGILIFNKHLLFLLTVIVLFVGWLLFYTIYYFIEYNNKFVHWIDPKGVAEFDFLSTAATRGNEPIGGTYHIFVDQTAIGLGQRGTNVFKVFLIRDGGNVPASQFYLPNKNFGMNLSPNNTNEGYYMRVPLEEERTA